MTAAVTSNPLFIAVGPFSQKVECSVCGRSGYDTRGLGWQVNCLRGHGPCARCGTPRPLNKAGQPRYCGGRSQCAKDHAA